MTSKVGPKGQVVIPKQMREQLRIHPGDEVDFVLEEGAVRVMPAPNARTLRGRFAGVDLTGALERDRRAERLR